MLCSRHEARCMGADRRRPSQDGLPVVPPRDPACARQLETGTILVTLPAAQRGGTAAIYARVSSHDHRPDLDRQIVRLAAWAGRHGYAVSRTEAEVGSGLHGRRRPLLRLRADPEISTIIVAPRDRLARFGAEYVEAALAASGRCVVIADPGATTADVVRDRVDGLASVCARLYGRRSARGDYFPDTPLRRR